IDFIVWSVSGKVKEIIRSTQSNAKNIKFDYDAMGHRIAKHVVNNQTGVLEKSTYYILDAQGNQLSVYEHEVNNSQVLYNLKENHIFGSSRLGMLNQNINMYSTNNSTNVSSILGNKSYELSNHLGNVNAVISDIKIPQTTNTSSVSNYTVNILSINDYSGFGVQLDGRTVSNNGLRYGFNGYEADNEVKGNGNSYTTDYRQYDPRLGRWLTLDPLMAKYPNQSPYVAFNNNPIYFVDPLGLEGGPAKEPYHKTLNPAPKNIEVTETYSCDQTYSFKLDNGETFTLDPIEGQARMIKANGTEYKATYSTDPKKAGEFLGYYSTDGKSTKFTPREQYNYAWNYFTSDANFNKFLGQALEHWYNNTDSYIYEHADGVYSETDIFNGDNYNCWEFALALTQDRQVNYSNCMKDNTADNQLASNYENVAPNKAIPGQTIIRMAYKMNGDYYNGHYAVYLGKNAAGGVIVATKNGTDAQPRIMLLDDLLKQHPQFGVLQGLGEDKSAYYNLK
ncbi:MAG: hypothetical protein HYR91_13345, partial [Flavobacteriia bacterium]|nr:hypothetical protein [Flavobacteriia bacterium]